MHNPPSSSSSPPQPNMDTIDDSSTSIWDWSQFLDFNIDDHLPLPNEPEFYPPIPPPPPPPLPLQGELVNSNSSTTNNNNNRVRKRDPRTACSNFLAGRIPCACPELDAQLAAEEEEAAAPGKKKTRTISNSRCQVPGCEVDISELKGYHKRHRVCLTCATATTVVLDGLNKRYCQQCGK